MARYHMILQKSHAGLVLKKHLLLLMLKILNIFVETMVHFFQDSLMNRKFKRTAFI